MNKTWVILPVLAFFCLSASAQVIPRRFIRSFGEGTVSATPDQAKIQFSVVTQAVTAEAAAAQNATQVTTLLAALRSVLGQNAELKTLSYSLNPNYSSPRDGSQPIILGYTASNTVEATVTDLALIGKLIDTGIQAGGNRVQGLRFGLKDDQPQRQQALKLATAQAKAHADAMASGLNLKAGAVVSIQEGSVISPVLSLDARALAAPSTPIETGQVDVHATVTLEVDLTQ
jgi:uncharacterized protein YggE